MRYALIIALIAAPCFGGQVFDGRGTAIATPCTYHGTSLPDVPSDATLLSLGLYRSIETRIGAAEYFASSGLVLTHYMVAVVAPYELSKYIILERIIARGKGEAFLAALSSDPLTKARWDAAAALDSDNPLLLAVRDQLIPALGLTAADAAQILRPGRDIP